MQEGDRHWISPEEGVGGFLAESSLVKASILVCGRLAHAAPVMTDSLRIF